ncbi:MAG: glycosyltransferase family 2 protein [Silicimonas sp.]|jgi:dolichol-phosphate mannosyltransferase|nr:glycosyltransferase family 2 protein [Silicimonas sp.]
MPDDRPEFSIVVPMKNEAANVAHLAAAIEAACEGRNFEAIFVDDGSDDGTAETAGALGRPWLRIARHPKSAGQSAAVHTGVMAARAPVICTMDGDGQNPPAELPRMVAPLLSDTPPGLVAGERQGRKDTASKRWASKFANGLRGWLLKDGTRDTGCGLKAFRRDDFLRMPFFNHMHRYLPALFKAHGLSVMHLPVSHEDRHAGASNYTNFQRALVGVVDLFGVMWLIRRAKRVSPDETTWPDDASAS